MSFMFSPAQLSRILPNVVRPQAYAGCPYNNTAVDGYWYWVGTALNFNTIEVANGRDVAANGGVQLYRSSSPNAAFGSWEYVGNILAAPLVSIARPSIIYNAATAKFVLWSSGYDPFNGAFRPACIATASTITGPWTWQTTTLMPGGVSYFQDNNLYQEGTDAYSIFSLGGYDGIRIAKLTSNYLNTTNVGGESIDLLVGTQGSESPVLFKRGSTYFLLTSGYGNYYNSQVTFKPQYQTATSIFGTWSAPTPLYAYDPAGGPYNGQLTAAYFDGTDYYVLTDFWNNFDLRQSYSIRLPLVFATSTTVRPTLPTTNDIASLSPISWRVAEVVASPDNDFAVFQANNGEGVQTWRDRLAVDASQATSGSRPTYVANAVNGYPALSFDGVNDFLAFTPHTAKHVFVVCRPDDAGTTLGGMFGNSATSVGIRRIFNFGSNEWIGSGGNASDFGAGGTTKVNGVTTDVHTNQTWAILEVSNSSAGTFNNIGYYDVANSRPWKGMIREIVEFDYVLSAPQAAIVRAQLAVKPGISTI